MYATAIPHNAREHHKTDDIQLIKYLKILRRQTFVSCELIRRSGVRFCVAVPKPCICSYKNGFLKNKRRSPVRKCYNDKMLQFFQVQHNIIIHRGQRGFSEDEVFLGRYFRR